MKKLVLILFVFAASTLSTLANVENYVNGKLADSQRLIIEQINIDAGRFGLPASTFVNNV